MGPKEILDVLSGAGVLGFAVLAIYAFLTERIVPLSRLEEQRREKKEALDLARTSIASMDRLSAAVEARNELEAERMRWDRRGIEGGVGGVGGDRRDP